MKGKTWKSDGILDFHTPGEREREEFNENDDDDGDENEYEEKTHSDKIYQATMRKY